MKHLFLIVEQHIPPTTLNRFRLLETIETVDGPRTRVCEGTWRTIEEVGTHIDNLIDQHRASQ